VGDWDFMAYRGSKSDWKALGVRVSNPKELALFKLRRHVKVVYDISQIESVGYEQTGKEEYD
jgi:hypothetical protein